MIYLHICEFPGYGWAYGMAPSAMRIEYWAAIKFFKTREACEAAAVEHAKEGGWDSWMVIQYEGAKLAA